MIPAVTNRHQVIYGPNFTAGGTSEIWIDGPVHYSRDYDSGQATLAFDAIIAIQESDALSELEVLQQKIEAAVDEPNLYLRWIADSQTIFEWNPEPPFTGYLTRARIEKSGSETDTLRSRRLRITFTVQTPALATGYNGRRNESVEVAEDASGRRRVTVSGQYTATASNTAMDNYNASVATWEASVIAAVAPGARAFERVETTLTPEAQSVSTGSSPKIMGFRRVHLERISDQAVGVADDPDLRNSSLTISEQATSTGPVLVSGKRGTPLRTITATYSADVEASVDLRAKYSSTVRPLIFQEAAAFSGGFASLESENVHMDPEARRIEATLQFLGLGSDRVLEVSLEITDEITLPRTVAPFWGGPYAARDYPAHGALMRTVATRVILARQATSSDLLQDRAMTPLAESRTLPQPGKGRWVLIKSRRSVRSGYRGAQRVDEVSEQHAYQWLSDPSTSQSTTGAPASVLG